MQFFFIVDHFKIIARVLLLAMLWLGASSQNNPRFLNYNVRDGLSQNSVHCVFQDRDGLVWLGTQDGLNSFDGKDFTVYRHDDNDPASISDQFVVSIKEDRAGYLWIGTRNGLNRFNKNTGQFTRFYIDAKEKHAFQASYEHFFIQSDGRIAIPRSNKLHLLNPSNNNIATISSPQNRSAAWHVNADYSTWLLIPGSGLYHSPDIRSSTCKKISDAPFREQQSVYILGSGNKEDPVLYFPGAGNIYRFDTRSNSWLAPVAIPLRINQLTVTGNGRAYAASNAGIYEVSDGKVTGFIKNDPGNNNSLPPGNILCTFTDREKNLWIGTAGNGLAISNGSFNHFVLLKTILQNDVITAVVRLDNNLYFGSHSGLYKIPVTGKNTYGNIETIVSNKKITALTVDSSRNFWFAADNEGLLVTTLQGALVKKFTTTNSPLYGNRVHQLITDSKGRILVSNDLSFQVIHSLNGPWTTSRGDTDSLRISGGYVMNTFEDREKNIWVSNNRGLDVFTSDLKPLHTFPSNDDSASPIKRTIVTSSTQDKNGDTWISTIRNGVYRYSKNSFTHYTSSSGLNSDVVYNVICDDRNRIWATTSTGLNIFDPEQQSFTSASALDGVPNTAFVLGAVIKDAEGNILLGTSDGLLICKAAEVTLHKTRISGLIRNVKVNGQYINLQNRSLTIMSDGKIISFEFVSSPAFYSGDIIYQYRLKGASDTWTTLPRGVHSVSYTGLPYKDLQLEVRAATSVNGLLNAPIDRLTINSKAPFWKTGWFLLLAGFITVLFISLLVMEYNRRRYRRQLRQIQMEKELQGERERIGRDLHDNIGAYTSALIAGLNQLKATDEDQLKHVDDLKDYAVNIMGFLRETIWMLNSQTLTITAFADRFKNYALRISRNYPAVELKISESIQQDKSLAPAVMLNLFRILQEGLQNAYKHAGASVISINIGSAAQVRFELSDNGTGFNEVQKTGHYGLMNMRQRAAEAGFSLHIESNGGRGTTLLITENTAYAAVDNKTGTSKL